MRGLLNSSLCVLALLLVMCAPAYATFPGENGKIAFATSDEIAVVNPDGAGTGFAFLTSNAFDDVEPAWSPDGTKLLFSSNRFGRYEVFLMNADGSGQANLTSEPAVDDREPAWSPDGQRIVFTRYAAGCSTLVVIDLFGSNIAELDPTPDCERRPDWSPNGGAIAFTTSPTGPGSYRLFLVEPDGTNVQQLADAITPSSKPRWSPGGVWLAIDGRALEPDGTPTGFLVPHNAEWSPDGSRLLWAGTDPELPPILIANEQGGEEISPVTAAGGPPAPDWQPLPPPPPLPDHQRPKGATPVQLSLVPAYKSCEAPDRVHGPPLAFGSCSSPAAQSGYLTVGTGDSNGQAARFAGSLRLDVRPGNPATPDDEADVAVSVDMTDVRCRSATEGCAGGALSDYAGELEAVLPMRITDRFNSGLGTQPATTEVPFQSRVTVQCVATSDPTVGARCALHTTVDAVMPGQVRERKRAIWALEQVQVVDGGADGDAATDDYTLFAVPGLFVP